MYLPYGTEETRASSYDQAVQANLFVRKMFDDSSLRYIVQAAEEVEESTMLAHTPSKITIVLDHSEVLKLSIAIERFLALGLLVMKTHKGPYYTVVQQLNDLRPLLARFSDPATGTGVPDPIHVLNSAGVKDFQDVGKILLLATQCVQVARYLSMVMTILVRQQAELVPALKQPYRIDLTKEQLN